MNPSDKQYSHNPIQSAQLMVGLEIHIELATSSKMFTRAPNVAYPENYTTTPNTLCDPRVMALPGVLPVINRHAVELAITVGHALNCKIAECTRWERKSYFYPDLPKGYQITQYHQPLCYDGCFDLPLSDDHPLTGGTKTINIIRAHLEEDAGKLFHLDTNDDNSNPTTLVDYNRAGTPLLEIVTQPDFDSVPQIVRFAKMIRDICRHLNISECILQKGHMRFEPNINVIITADDGQTYDTPIVEIKNLNSFRALKAAIKYEYHRQLQQWINTGTIKTPGSKRTRGWDDNKQITFTLRDKEEAHDYRYFPDPDLPQIIIKKNWQNKLRSAITELPYDKQKRYIMENGLSVKNTCRMLEDPQLCQFYDACCNAAIHIRALAAADEDNQIDDQYLKITIANCLLQAGSEIANEHKCKVYELGITPKQFAQTVQLRVQGKINSNTVKQLLELLCNTNNDAEIIAQEYNLLQINDAKILAKWLDEAIKINPRAVADMQAGKDKAQAVIIGYVMKCSVGKADARVIDTLLKNKYKNK